MAFGRKYWLVFGLIEVSLLAVLYVMSRFLHPDLLWIGAGLILGALLQVFLGRLVLAQVARLHQTISQLGARGDFTARVSLPEADELVGLTQAINGMLATLEQTHQQRRESEERYRAVVEQTSEGIFLVSADSLRILESNSAFQRLVGYSAKELRRMTFADLIVYEAESINQTLADVVTGKYHFMGEKQCRHKNGQLLLVEVSSNRVVYGGKKILCNVVHDISRRKQAEAELRLAAKVFETATEGILITDTRTNIIKVNQAFTTITGYSLEEVIGKTPRILHSGQQTADFYEDMWASLNSTGRWEGELWNRRKNGELYPEYLTINGARNNQGQLTHYVGVLTDITTRKQTEARLQRLAYHDSLTGLPNRALFHVLLTQALAKIQRHHRKGAILFVDLDRFKNVNDTLGHAIGDLLLKQVADRLTHGLRESDVIARLGGDELTVLLEEMTQVQDAATVAQKILTLLGDPFELDGNEIFVTASIGISLFPDDGTDLHTLLKNADVALYQAKERGRNDYAFYTVEMNATALKRLALENNLRRALERGEFHVHYQPRVAMSGGRVVAVEALLRWYHPELGMVSPTQFIGLAEETGMIVPIGEWVLRAACAQAKAWQQAGRPLLRVSVNVSGRQFKQTDLVGIVAQALSDTGLEPEYLELELTESVIMTEADAAATRLQALKDMGVHLSVDDFGTGYSSLGYLKRFPIDTLKIDQSFVRDYSRGADAGAIIQAIIAMAHSLKINVTAEGIETTDQVAFLQTHQCDEGQGYYFGAPVRAEEVWNVLPIS